MSKYTVYEDRSEDFYQLCTTQGFWTRQMVLQPLSHNFSHSFYINYILQIGNNQKNRVKGFTYEIIGGSALQVNFLLLIGLQTKNILGLKPNLVHWVSGLRINMDLIHLALWHVCQMNNVLYLIVWYWLTDKSNLKLVLF